MLTITTLKYFCINHGDQRFFNLEMIINPRNAQNIYAPQIQIDLLFLV